MAVHTNPPVNENQGPQIITLYPGLSFSFGKTPLFELPLSSEKIVIRGGDICAVFGPNGCGKTTLLNLLSGFLRPTTGQVCFGPSDDAHGIVIKSSAPRWLNPAAKIAQWDGGVRRTFQVPVISPDISITGHISVARRMKREETFTSWYIAPIRRLFQSKNQKYEIDDTSCEESEQLLKAFNLNKSISNPNTLSYGQKRLLNIAQAIFGGKRLLMLDEPFANLSTSAIAIVKQMFRDFVASKDRAVVLVEHRAKNLPDFTNGLITMRDGLLRFEALKGTKEEEERFISKLISSYFG